MTWLIHEESKGEYTAIIRQEKYNSCYHLDIGRVENSLFNPIKKGIYMTEKNAKQAIKRFWKNYLNPCESLDKTTEKKV